MIDHDIPNAKYVLIGCLALWYALYLYLSTEYGCIDEDDDE